MDFDKVNKILESKSETEVNTKLERGWTLLTVDTVIKNDTKELVYVLGWTHRETEEEYVDSMESLKSLPF